MRRTDAHRPSAINPEDYDFIACDYYGPWASESFAFERAAFRKHMEHTGGKFARHYNSGICHVCGAAALSVAKYYHRISNTYIVLGMDCAAKMDFGGTDAFKAFKGQVSHERHIYKGKIVAREILALLGMSDAWVIYSNGADGQREEGIIRDMVYNLIRYGNWSEKQADYCRKLLTSIASRAEREAARVAVAHLSNHVGTIGQRMEFSVEVIGTAIYESNFGIVNVHIMKSGNDKIIYKGNKIAAKGDVLKMVATVKKHAEYKGEKQTIVNRPKVIS